MPNKKRKIIWIREILPYFLFFLTAVLPVFAASAAQKDILEMSLEELMEIEIEPTASLTKTTRRLQPSAVTTITQEDIQASGARSLNKLLEIYVPNLQMILHHWESRHLGVRGINSDREEKYLLLVNGRVMNERTHYGVLSERDLSMLGDIHHIDIIRGPGSAIYGAGALSMIVNIVTDNAMTFEGLELISRVGAVEEFYSQEIKYGKKLDDERGIFAYLGIDKYLGADQGDAPFVLGASFTDLWGVPVTRGEGVDYPINRHNASYRGLERIKSHIEYTDGPFEFWTRYTRGGEQFTYAQDNLASNPYGWMSVDDLDTYPSHSDLYQPGCGYQQLTMFAGYKQEISSDLTIHYSFSYDMFDFERASFNSKTNTQWNLSHREDEYLFKLQANWEVNEEHSLAFGGEWSHERFGLDSPGFPGDDVLLAPYERAPYNGDSPRWSSDTYSGVVEDQWRFNDRWIAFFGVRMDKTETTNYLFSPRFSLVHTPNDKDTWKLMLGRSQRMTFAEQMRHKWDLSNGKSDSEEMDTIEIRYERQHSPNLWFAVSSYYFDLDVIAWDSGTSYSEDAYGGTTSIGDYQCFGIEAEVLYQKDDFKLSLSHGFTKLLNFYNAPGVVNNYSAEPFGYGDDLANWSNHISKIVTSYKFDDKWKLDGNAQIYWGFPGAKDYAQYVTDKSGPVSRESGYDTPYGPSVFFSMGLQYQPNENMTVRIDAYDLMGLFNKKYNKTLYGFNSYGDYRSSAPSLAFTLSYKF